VSVDISCIVIYYGLFEQTKLTNYVCLMDAAPQSLIETLRERMFKPTLSTIITEDTK
jgi:hypothetical protein